MKTTLHPKRSSFLGSLKDGFLLILPLWATVSIFIWLWKLAFSFFPDFAGFFPPDWRGFPQFDLLLNLAFLLSLILASFIFGLIGPTFLGKFFTGFFDAVLEASPLIKPIYGTLKKIAAMLFSTPAEEESIESKLTEAVMVPYPSVNDWSIAFVTNKNANHFFGEEKGEAYITVYMPSSPIISSGYYLTVKKSDTRPCKSNAGQVVATLLSAGSLQAAPVLPVEKPKKKKLAFFRRIFLQGLLLMTPALGTASIFLWAFNWILKYVRTMRILIPGHLQGMIPEAYFGLISNTAILLLLILSIYLLGKLGESALGKAFHRVFINLTKKIPVFNTVYEATSTITEIFTKGASETEFFSKAVLVNFPNKKLLAVGFVTHKNSAHLMDEGVGFVPIFLPTSPIPTTGWFMNIPKEDLIPVDMPVEKAIALIISLGISSTDLK